MDHLSLTIHVHVVVWAIVLCKVNFHGLNNINDRYTTHNNYVPNTQEVCTVMRILVIAFHMDPHTTLDSV